MRLWAPVVIAMGAIFYVSGLQDAPLPSGMSDKSGHGLAYLALGVTVVRALAGGLARPITPGVALAAVAVTVGFGITDEIHQAFVPGRTAEIADLWADAAGAIVAVVVCWAWGIISTRAASRRASP